uniref:uncharacterized protein LOC113475374 n=1 Tax=Ciona intestinalis TaxID=7719 RepID=UPI000EF48FFA|nr:uncharacterized protein LOC113475374 [Ciona intestinalis]|eukprot:XP_026695269.1 uncharacterized protein LOC113475374 [Ciona intestinalis]
MSVKENSAEPLKQEELLKTRQHLSLLREQYVKLQVEHAELQRSHFTLKALQGGSGTNDKLIDSTDHSLASGLIQSTTKLFGRNLFSPGDSYKSTSTICRRFKRHVAGCDVTNRNVSANLLVSN